MGNVAYANFVDKTVVRSIRMENQKMGHFALFRSLLSADWALDVGKLALWVRLIGQATHKPRTVSFNGVEWSLAAGQLVTKYDLLCRKLRDAEGKEKSPQQVRRMLDFFVSQGMLSYSGNRHGTVISITNYSDYQLIADQENGNNHKNGAEGNKPSAGAALSGIAGGNDAGGKSGGNSEGNKPSAVAALSHSPEGNAEGKCGVHEQEVIKQELKHTQTHDVGLLDVSKKTPRQAGTNPRALGTNPRSKSQVLDRERFKNTWNCKAEKHGLPKMRSFTVTVESGLKRLWASYLKQCKELGKEPTDIDTFINGYIEFGYKPSAWACGENPSGKKYGIETALTQRIIDEVLGRED